jgi:hypothetical protein
MIANAVKSTGSDVKPTSMTMPKLGRGDKTIGDVWEKALLYSHPLAQSYALVEHLAVATVMTEERLPLSANHADLLDVYQSLCNTSLWVRCDLTTCGKWRTFVSNAKNRCVYRQWRKTSFACSMMNDKPCTDPCGGRCGSMPCQCDQVWQRERSSQPVWIPARHMYAGQEGHSDQAANGRNHPSEESRRGPGAQVTRVRAYLFTF